MKELYILTENKALGIEEWMFMGKFCNVEWKNDRTVFTVEESNNDKAMSYKLISEVSIPNSRVYKFE